MASLSHSSNAGAGGGGTGWCFLFSRSALEGGPAGDGGQLYDSPFHLNRLGLF